MPQITVKDLAKICGVSRATIDRALHGKAQISEATRKRVLAAAKQYGYRPDLLARGLAKGKTQRIGVVAFDMKTAYSVQLLTAIEAEARRLGYAVNITFQDYDSEREISLIRDLVNYRMDGLLLCPVNKGPEFERFLLDLPVPVVTMGHWVSDKIPLVGIEEYEAGQMVFRHLHQKGYRRIVFTCPAMNQKSAGKNNYIHEQRLAGLLSQAPDFPETELLEAYDEDLSDAVRRIRGLLPKKTAFFCSGDLPAMELCLVLKAEGLRVPEDFGVMGFGNIELLRYMEPKIETVDSSIGEVGAEAARQLIERIQGSPAEPFVYVGYHIVAGNSL